ncbi:ATP-binding cassette sub-family A member 3, partial [Geodia barretti]
MAGEVASNAQSYGGSSCLCTWKTSILQIRRPIGTVFELLIPPLAVVVLIGLRFGIFQPEDQCFTTFPSDPLTVPLPNNTYQIFYTPINNDTERIASCISKALPFANVMGVENEQMLLGNLSENSVDPPLEFTMRIPVDDSNFTIPVRGDAGCFIGGAGIVFNNVNRTKNDGRLEYTLRLRHEVGEDDSWETREAAPNFQLTGPRVRNNFYLSEGFVHLQNVVGEAIIRLMANSDMTECEGVLQPEISVSMRQLPYPQYTIDVFLSIIVTILPFFVILAYIYSAGIFTKELVLEKETRIRESMLMMGLQQWVLWTTWFIKQFILLLISAIFVTILLKFGQVFPNSDFLLLLIFFILYIISFISFCFFLSVWFNTARVGLLVGFLGWFMNYVPYLFVPGQYNNLDLGGKIAFCILSNSCMGLGINTISLLEIRGEGVQWGNFAEDISLDDDFHLGYVFLMLIVDSIVYMLIAWYVNGVKPGQYGVPKPIYFPFQPSYWLGRPLTSKTKKANQLVSERTGGHDPSAHEDEPKDLPVGISINNLTKIYDENLLVKLLASHEEREKRRKVAVDSLNLNMYEGQITALLGHNGAGKTTTMSILTGWCTSSYLTAYMDVLPFLFLVHFLYHYTSLLLP